MATNKKSAKKAAPKKAAKPAKKAPAAKKLTPKKAAKPIKKEVARHAKKAEVKKPAVKKVAPVAHKSTAVAHKSAPIAHKPAPVAHKPAPVAHKPLPVKKVEKPVHKPEPQPLHKLPEIRKVVKEAAKPEPRRESKPVILPKLTTTVAKKYEPDFTKSVLDQPELHQSGPTMRYSDVELTEFKELVLRKLEAAKKELAYLQGLITRKDDMGGDESENRYMTMEDGSISMEREQLSQMASRQIQYIDHLEKALMRIENKTYGICRVTGKLIDKARLRAVPHATLSIEAKMGYAKNPNIQ
ncbi:MAG: transcriptional regulator, TraR/DksA family protein [Bacteroidetes bacterium]|nr:MAG: transcriptional regulator, TraR/DksA family protein [Bacteroidota bacterium]